MIEEKTTELAAFKEGIFSLHTRRFGRVAELMIQNIYKLFNPKSNAYDLLTHDKKKIEVKFSRAQVTCKDRITKDNLIKQVLLAKNENRVLTLKMAQTGKYEFDCNIQQVKSKEFDILYYGFFFDDKIAIFRLTSEDIKKDKNLFYSNKQHRGNKNEGQFHINEKKLSYHIKNYLLKLITYEELYKIFKK